MFPSKLHFQVMFPSKLLPRKQCSICKKQFAFFLWTDDWFEEKDNLLGKMMTKAKMSNALKIRKSYLFISRLKLTNWFDDFGRSSLKIFNLSMDRGLKLVALHILDFHGICWFSENCLKKCQYSNLIENMGQQELTGSRYLCSVNSD